MWKKWSIEKPTPDIEWVIIKNLEPSGMSVFDGTSNRIGVALASLYHRQGGDIDVIGVDYTLIHDSFIDEWMSIDIKCDDIAETSNLGPTPWYPPYHGAEILICPWCGKHCDNIYEEDRGGIVICLECDKKFSFTREKRYFAERI